MFLRLRIESWLRILLSVAAKHHVFLKLWKLNSWVFFLHPHLVCLRSWRKKVKEWCWRKKAETNFKIQCTLQTLTIILGNSLPREIHFSFLWCSSISKQRIFFPNLFVASRSLTLLQVDLSDYWFLTTVLDIFFIVLYCKLKKIIYWYIWIQKEKTRPTQTQGKEKNHNLIYCINTQMNMRGLNIFIAKICHI